MNTKQITDHRIFSGLKDRVSFFAWLNPDLPHAKRFNRERLLSDYVETNEQVYEEFLEVLPPMKWERGHFAIIEATSDDVRLAFFKVGDRFFAAHISDDPGPYDIDSVHAAIVKAKVSA